MKLNTALVALILTCLPVFAKPSFTVIAHRGWPRYIPEHTLEGIEKVSDSEVDYVEPDVVLTKDNIAIVLHDVHLDATTDVAQKFPKRKRTDGRYYAIDFTLKEIKQLRANHRVNHETGEAAIQGRIPLKKSNYLVPTFQEFISKVEEINKQKKKNIGVYVELKKPSYHRKEGKDIGKIVQDILVNNPKVNFIVQCFEPQTLKDFRKRFAKKYLLVQLIGENSWKMNEVDYTQMLDQSGIAEIATYADAIGPWIPQLVSIDETGIKLTNLAKWAQSNKLKIHPYTLRNDSLPKHVASEAEVLNILINKVKVDGVFTDDAPGTLKALKTIKTK